MIRWKDWCWSWSSNTLAAWWEELTHWKKLWYCERLKAGGDGGDRGWDGWKASPMKWTWIWANSSRYWRSGKTAVLQYLGSQRVRHDLVIEQQHNSNPSRYTEKAIENWSQITQLIHSKTKIKRLSYDVLHRFLISPNCLYLLIKYDPFWSHLQRTYEISTVKKNLILCFNLGSSEFNLFNPFNWNWLHSIFTNVFIFILKYYILWV